MKLQFPVTVTEIVSVDVDFPLYINNSYTAWKFMDEKTCVEVEYHKYIACYAIRVWDEWPNRAKALVKDGQRITEDDFTAKYNEAYNFINSLPGNTLLEALKHLKEMTYTACTIEGKAYGAKIDAALSFLEEHQHLLEPKPEPVKEPALDLSDLPF